MNITYKRKQVVPDVLAVKWDGKNKTVKLIRDETCSQVPGTTAKKSGGDMLPISTAGTGTSKSFTYVGDYIVYDVLDKWGTFIRVYSEDTFNDYYEKAEE